MIKKSSAFSLLDQFIISVDEGLRTLFTTPVARRINPSTSAPESHLEPLDRKKSAAFMRINHVGEICAQALYRGQALTAKDQATASAMTKSAEEEEDHLAWCEARINELNTHKSYLNPLWYLGALSLGMMAGLFGDPYSLGFIVETERQVEKHLEKHLAQLPANDLKSRTILTQMQADEIQHATIAQSYGARELPPMVKQLMTFFSRIMTSTAYWI